MAKSRCLVASFGEKHAATLQGGTRRRPGLQLSIYCVRSGQLGSCWRKSLIPGTSKSSLEIPIAALVQPSRRRRIFANTSVGCYWRSSVCRQTILVRIHSFNPYVHFGIFQWLCQHRAFSIYWITIRIGRTVVNVMDCLQVHPGLMLTVAHTSYCG